MHHIHLLLPIPAVANQRHLAHACGGNRVALWVKLAYFKGFVRVPATWLYGALRPTLLLFLLNPIALHTHLVLNLLLHEPYELQ